MGDIIHIVEVAGLLLVAYSVGWAVGYVAHRLVARPAATVPAVPPERIAAVTGEALVKAPVIAPLPVPSPQPPSTPPSESVPPPAETASVENSAPTGDVENSSAVSPVEQPVSVALPRPEPAGVPAPEPPPAPAVAFTAMPSTRAGLAWSGEIRGHAATPFAREPAPTPAEAEDKNDVPVAGMSEPETPAIVAATANAEGGDTRSAMGLAETEAPPSSEAAMAGTPQPASVAIPPAAEPPASETPLAAAEPAAPSTPEPPRPEPVVDEDAAMRAIEGGWSRVGARAMPGKPELVDVGAAVAAAQSAVEQVLATAGIDPELTSDAGRPSGLSQPRAAGKDSLRRIAGVTELDELTLNNLGVYHFDQIAAWDEMQVLWMENHVFARGRIGREDWQGQARALAGGET